MHNMLTIVHSICLTADQSFSLTCFFFNKLVFSCWIPMNDGNTTGFDGWILSVWSFKRTFQTTPLRLLLVARALSCGGPKVVALCGQWLPSSLPGRETAKLHVCFVPRLLQLVTPLFRTSFPVSDISYIPFINTSLISHYTTILAPYIDSCYLYYIHMTCIAMYFGCTYYPHFPSALDIGAGAPKELKIEGPLLRPVEPVENQRGRWGADMVEDNPRECNWVVVVRKPDVMKYI